MQTLGGCFVCGTAFGQPLLHLPGPRAITSTARIIDAETLVCQCLACGHVQTRPLASVEAYYDADYNIRAENEGEDDLYAVIDGTPVYRSEHQARVALEVHRGLAAGARVLDFGCAKAASLKQIGRARPDLALHVFDVSANYRSFWDTFVPSENQATHQVKPEWDGYFDLILSFFALEHTADPRKFVADLARMLKPGGVLHVVFPNMYANVADMVVVDHVNHFGMTSIHRLFGDAGLTVTRLDTTLHNAAFVVVAGRGLAGRTEPPSPDQIKHEFEEAASTAQFWGRARDDLRRFEAAAEGPAAIYGSGVYGLFIATNLAEPGRVTCFLDQNPHQQGKTILGKPIIAPAAIADDIAVVHVGLNPRSARSIAASVEALHRRPREFFFFER